MWYRFRGSFKSTGLSALFVVLLNLLVLSGPAYASAVGSALPIGTTPGISGAAQSAGSAVQPAVAPVTKTIAPAVEKTTAPVTNTTSKSAPTATAPASSAVIQSAGKAAKPVLDTTTQTVGKTAAPVLNTAAQTVGKTAAPVLKTVGKTAAPVVKTVGQSLGQTVAPVLKTAAPVLTRTEQTLVKAAAPVLQTATHALGHVAAPVGTATTVAGVLQGVDGATALVSKAASEAASQGIGQVTTPANSTVMQIVSPARTGAPHLIAPLTTPSTHRARPNPPVMTTQNPSSARYSGATNTTAPTTAPSWSMLPSPLKPAPGAPQSHSASAKELVSESMSALAGHQLVQISGMVAQIASIRESLAAFASPRSTGNHVRQVATLASSSALPAPGPTSPLPGGSSGAMASAAGVAFSIFLTLAGLLLMGGLAAKRLLRLASEPWRAAPFVLIPERPG